MMKLSGGVSSGWGGLRCALGGRISVRVMVVLAAVCALAVAILPVQAARGVAITAMNGGEHELEPAEPPPPPPPHHENPPASPGHHEPPPPPSSPSQHHEAPPPPPPPSPSPHHETRPHHEHSPPPPPSPLQQEALAHHEHSLPSPSSTANIEEELSLPSPRTYVEPELPLPSSATGKTEELQTPVVPNEVHYAALPTVASSTTNSSNSTWADQQLAVSGDQYNLCTYTIVTKTGNIEGAGTTADVNVQFFNRFGHSVLFVDLKSQSRNFQQGATDTFTLVDKCVHDICRMHLSHDDAGPDPSWFVNTVTVSLLFETHVFNVFEWLSKNEPPYQLSREISLCQG